MSHIVETPPVTPQGMRVVLVGGMAAGKSTAAREWAVAGGPVLWFDSDDVIAQRAGCDTVSEAFDQLGEPAFRELERSVILERDRPLAHGLEVWSLGSGAIEDPDVQRVIISSNVVVWLDADEDVLFERAAALGDRPLARDRAVFAQRLRQRRAVWESLADVRMETSGDEHPHLGSACSAVVPPALIESTAIVAPGCTSMVSEIGCIAGERPPIVIVGEEVMAPTVDSVSTSLRRAGVNVVDAAALPLGEWAKQLSTVHSLLQRWASAGVRRDAVVIAIGGGATLDTVGCAASLYNRGLRWVALPSTLLAQVDASIGGKVAVNLGRTKNVVGAFHAPQAVLIDPDLLRTLPADVMQDGYAELLKTALIAGLEEFEDLERATSDGTWISTMSSGIVTSIAMAVAAKEAIVAEDPLDAQGIRAVLNLGHTLAHAIEAATSGAVSHGRAVAFGLRLALSLSTRICGLDSHLVERVGSLLDANGHEFTAGVADLPAWSELEPWMAADKKLDADGLAWVLLASPGHPVSGVRIPRDEVETAWHDLVGAGAHVVAAPRKRRDVLIVFGVNLADVGQRDPHHYGARTLAQIATDLREHARTVGLSADIRQTDSLEMLLSWLREARHSTSLAGVIINPGAWTHSEYAIHDALELVDVPVVEVHLSDVAAREAWRQVSVLSDVVEATISGHGEAGLIEALELVARAAPGVQR